MAEQQTSDADTQSAAERVSMEQPAGDGAAVAKAMEHVNSIVSSIAKMAGEKQEPEATGAESKETSTAKSSEEGAGEELVEPTQEEMAADVEKAKKGGFPKMLFKQMLMKAGVKDAGALKGILEGLEKQFGASGINPKGDMKKTTKAAETAVTVEMLQKAAAFTPERVEALQEAFDTLKLVIEAIAPNASPATKVPESTNGLGGSGVTELSAGSPKPVMKSAEEESEVLKALNGLSSVVKNLAERVEGIEKAKPASNSIEEEGGSETTTKKSGSLWGGLL